MGAPIVLTQDKERIVRYTLTPDGAKQLRAAGIRSGAKVPARILAALIRAGQADSPCLRQDFERAWGEPEGVNPLVAGGPASDSRGQAF